jgi:hypothetical protein
VARSPVVCRQFGRRLIAGLAAYVVALQLFLPGFALAQVAATADHNVICALETNVGGEPVQHPADHHATCVCCGCTLAGGGSALGPTPASHAIVWRRIVTTYDFARPANSGPPSRDIASGPHNPRAPPTA